MIYKFWRIWAKTLGSKISEKQFESDVAAVLRTLWVGLQVLTCLIIIAGVIRHWGIP